MTWVTPQIVAYSVTDRIPIHSTVIGSKGEYNSDISRLARVMRRGRALDPSGDGPVDPL